VNMSKKRSIIYIATDRTWAGTLNLYGGYNIYPNLEEMAKYGTLYQNAIATAGSTLMCHSSEWTGKYTWDLHPGIPMLKRGYNTVMPTQDSVFYQMENRGYETHLVMVKKNPKKCFDTYSQVKNLWTNDTKIHLINDWDVSGNTTNRLTQIKEALSCVNQSQQKNKPAFVWVKCHGLNEFNKRMEYLKYNGQQRITLDDLYNAEIDESIGIILKEIGFPKNDEIEIIFASDHGSFHGQGGKYFYGYCLDQEIIHVPLISSIGGGKLVTKAFSMRNVKNMLIDRSFIPDEKYIFSETLYPGQVSDKPNNGISSMSKIMVRRDKYKYIYARYGQDGNSDKPEEMMYDLEYDPHEKINLIPVLKGEKFRDITRGDLSGKNMTTVFTRLHTNIETIKDPNISPRYLKDRFRSGSYVGWTEVYDIWSELQAQARAIWSQTGREKHFKV